MNVIAARESAFLSIAIKLLFFATKIFTSFYDQHKFPEFFLYFLFLAEKMHCLSKEGELIIIVVWVTLQASSYHDVEKIGYRNMYSWNTHNEMKYKKT